MPEEKVVTTPVPPAFVSAEPFEHERIGAAAVYCSDGRYGEQMDEFLHKGLGLPRYDRVAVPGGAACLAGYTLAFQEGTAVERQLSFLIKEHELKRIVLIAHESCGFYKHIWHADKPLEQLQQEDLQKAAEQIRLWKTDLVIEAYFARKSKGRVIFERWETRLIDQWASVSH
jgi:hypothetical protein